MQHENKSRWRCSSLLHCNKEQNDIDGSWARQWPEDLTWRKRRTSCTTFHRLKFRHFTVPRIFAHTDKVTVSFGIASWCAALSKILIYWYVLILIIWNSFKAHVSRKRCTCTSCLSLLSSTEGSWHAQHCIIPFPTEINELRLVIFIF